MNFFKDIGTLIELWPRALATPLRLKVLKKIKGGLEKLGSQRIKLSVFLWS
jgi:hypothetical protein